MKKIKTVLSGICSTALLISCSGGEDGDTDSPVGVGAGGSSTAGVGGSVTGAGGAGAGGSTVGAGGSLGVGGGAMGAGGSVPTGMGGSTGAGGAEMGAGGADDGSGGSEDGSGGAEEDGAGGGEDGSGGAANVDCVDVGASDNFSFFVTSWDGIKELSQSNDGFGGDLRWPDGETDGLQGADNICQELASRVCHGHKTWKAYLSTSQINAIDHVEGGPWYSFTGEMIGSDKAALTSGSGTAGSCDGTAYTASDRLTSAECGTYDELGTLHDGGAADIDGNGSGQDDDHDTVTGTLADGTYAGFSCEDWTSTTATSGGGGMMGGPGGGGGVQMGHSWPARSGQGWSQAHAGHQCTAGVNFDGSTGPGDSTTIGGGGGYGGFYCFATTSE